MDMQDMVNMMNKTRKDESAKEYSLGKFIDHLKRLPPYALLFVIKGYGCAGLDSWRGSYCELAMSYKKSKHSTIGDVLSDAEVTLGKTLTGYKGGDFLMDKDTPIHVANYGESDFNHKKYESGMLFTDDYEPEKKDSKDNFMTHHSVKVVGIELFGKNYILKLRVDD